MRYWHPFTAEAIEQFRAAAGFDAVYGHYRGIGPAITDMLGGQIQVLMPGLASWPAACAVLRGEAPYQSAAAVLPRTGALVEGPAFHPRCLLRALS